MGTFEHDIEQQLSNFRLEPSAHVWQGVEASLLEKKKRRVVAWWWIPVVGLFLLGLGFWIVSSNTKEAPRNLAIATTSTDKNYNAETSKKESKNQLETGAKNKRELVNGEQSIRQDEIVNTYKTDEKSNFLTPAKASKHGKESFKKLSMAYKSNPYGKNKKEQVSGDSFLTKMASQEHNAFVGMQPKNAPINDSSSSKTNLQVGVKDSLATIIKPILSEKKDSAFALLDSADKKEKTTRAKGKNWFLVIGGGMSYVRDNNLFGGGGAASNAAFQSAMTGSGLTGGGSSASYITPQTGFSFLLGLAYEHNLSKRFCLQTGLQYRYVQNKAFVFYSNNQNILMDLANPVTNYSHLVQVPISLKYNLISKPSFDVQAIIGGSMAMSLSQKWIAMPGNDSFVYNNSYNSTFFASGHIGLAFAKKNGFGISLLAEQSLTPIHKSNSPKYY